MLSHVFIISSAKQNSEYPFNFFEVSTNLIVLSWDIERFAKAEKLSSHTLQHIKHASAVLLNKCDLADKKTIKEQKSNLKHLNHNIHACIKCKLELDKVLKSSSPLKLGGRKKKAFAPHLLWEIKKHWGLRYKKERHKGIDAYVFETYGLIDVEKLKQVFIRNNIPRAKGFVYLGGVKPFYFSVVGNHFSIQKAPRFDIKGRNKIIIIGDNIYSKRNILRRQLQRCVKKSMAQSIRNFVMDNWSPRPKKVLVLEPLATD